MPASTLSTRPRLWYSPEELSGLMLLAVRRRDRQLLALTLQHVVAQGLSLANCRTDMDPASRTWLASTLTAGAMGRA